MGSIAVIVVGAIYGRMVGALASIVLVAVTGVVYAAGSMLARPLGAVFGSLIAGTVALVWTALTFLIAQRLIDNDVATAWVIWLTAILLAMVPIGLAMQGADTEARRIAMQFEQNGEWASSDNAAMCEAFQRGGAIQLIGGAFMLFNERVWDWWRWLPFG